MDDPIYGNSSFFRYFRDFITTMSLQEFVTNFLEEEEVPKSKVNPLESMKNITGFERTIDVTVPAVMSKSSPPFGPSLAQCGVNVSTFCEDYNEMCEEEELMEEFPFPLRVYLRVDKTYEIVIRTPTVSSLGEGGAGWNKGEYNDRDFFRYKAAVRLLTRRVTWKLKRVFRPKIIRKIKRRNSLTVLDLYKIFLLKKEEIEYYPNSRDEGVFKTLVSYLKKQKFFFKMEEEYYESKDYIEEKYEFRKAFLVVSSFRESHPKVSKPRRGYKKRRFSKRRKPIYQRCPF